MTVEDKENSPPVDILYKKDVEIPRDKSIRVIDGVISIEYQNSRGKGANLEIYTIDGMRIVDERQLAKKGYREEDLDPEKFGNKVISIRQSTIGKRLLIGRYEIIIKEKEEEFIGVQVISRTFPRVQEYPEQDARVLLWHLKNIRAQVMQTH